MGSRIVVLGGWATPPQVLRGVFGTQRTTYVDVNKLSGQLLVNTRLASDWVERLHALINNQIADHPDILAGWSTGAIMAAALAPKLAPAKLILLSATPSFCRRDTFKAGQRPSVLQSMRQAVDRDMPGTLESFHAECGFPNKSPELAVTRYTKPELEDGLFFLEQVSLLPVAPTTAPLHCLHGENDTVIRPEAGRFFSELAGGVFSLFSGPHAFFLDRGSEVASLVQDSYE